MCSCIRLNNCISDSTLKYNESAISLHNGREMDRFQERTERRTGKGLYSCVHACPCLFFKMALVEKSGFSGVEDSRKKGAAGTGRTAGRRKEWECIALSDFQRRRTRHGQRLA